MTHCNATLVETVCCGVRINIWINDQYNRVESTEVNPHSQGKRNFTKVPRSSIREIIAFQQMVLEHLDIHMQKQNQKMNLDLDPTLYTLCIVLTRS